MQRPIIVEVIRKATNGMFPGMEIWIFGSEARGDAHPDSDIDLLVLLDKEDIGLDDEMKPS